MLLDLHMPEMDGWTLLGELARDAELSRLPIIITSCDSAVPPGRASVAKPFDWQQLLAAVRDAIGRSA